MIGQETSVFVVPSIRRQVRWGDLLWQGRSISYPLQLWRHGPCAQWVGPRDVPTRRIPGVVLFILLAYRRPRSTV